MQGIAQRLFGEELEYPSFPMVTTTLYDLIEVICKEMDPDDDNLVADIEYYFLQIINYTREKSGLFVLFKIFSIDVKF